jgi:hypothetical protein
VAAERRTDEQIRGEIAAERNELVDALGELRAGVAGKRRAATAVAGVLAAAVATLTAVKLGRRLRG